jgi:hypothetical protein
MTRRELLTLFPLPALAQFSSSVRVVSVYATVRDRRGALVRNLTLQDFSVFEDGRRQTIRYFSADSDAPLTVGVLFDASGSQRNILAQQESAAQSFLRELLRPGDDSFRRSFGGANTTLYDSISAAAKRVEAQAGRKILVVLSDGFDTGSTVTLADTITAAHRANASVFPIHFYDKEVFRFNVPSQALDNLKAGKRALERIARETGGALLDDFAHIQEELRAQYSLGYTLPEGRPGYRKLRVEVKRGLRVQARDGYYAE